MLLKGKTGVKSQNTSYCNPRNTFPPQRKTKKNLKREKQRAEKQTKKGKKKKKKTNGDNTGVEQGKKEGSPNKTVEKERRFFQAQGPWNNGHEGFKLKREGRSLMQTGQQNREKKWDSKS